MNRYEDKDVKGLFYYEYHGDSLNSANEYAYLELPHTLPILIAEKDVLSKEIWYIEWENKADFESKKNTKRLSGYILSKDNINENYKEIARKTARKVLYELEKDKNMERE